MKWLALAIVVVAACAGILGLERKPAAFPHRAHVVAGVSCTSCHANVSDDDGPLHLPDHATCTSCHAKPHDSRPCLGCHSTANAAAELATARDHLVFDHGKHLPRTNNNCMRCHNGVAEGDERMRPAMATCYKCHDRQRDARDCNACHKNLEDATTLPATHLAHDGDWLHAHGTPAAAAGDVCASCHRERFCADCHGKTVAILPATAKFADPSTPSVHRAGFESRHALEARAEPGACETCHAPSRCASCHADRGVAGPGRTSPHPPGWIGLTAADSQHGREARRDPASCAGCHDGAGQALCVQCHAVGGVGGNPHPPGWSSRVPITQLPCRMCHSR